MEVREPAIAYGKKKYSIEEYLEMEDSATEKHEYYQGEIFAMSGAKHQHNLVIRNVYKSLLFKLDGKPCQPLGSDSRVHIEANTLFTYPDISVVCGEPKFRNDDEMNLLNPTVIVEVLSLSTRKYDKGEKFELYRAIPTLKEYITVDPEMIVIDAWRINANGRWELVPYSNMTDTLVIDSIATTIPLTDIYEGTKIALAQP